MPYVPYVGTVGRACPLILGCDIEIGIGIGMRIGFGMPGSAFDPTYQVGR